MAYPQKLDPLDRLLLSLGGIVTTVLVILGFGWLAQYFYNLVSLLGIVLVVTYILLGPVNFCTRWIEKISSLLHRRLPAFSRVSFGTPEVSPRMLAVCLVLFTFFMTVMLASIRLFPLLAHQLNDLSHSMIHHVSHASEAIIDWSDEKGGGTALKRIFEEDIEKAEKKGLVPKGSSLKHTSPDAQKAPPPAEVHISPEEKKVIQKSVAKSTLVQGLGLLEKSIASAVNNVLSLITGTLNGLIYFLAGLLLTFYFLVDGPALHRGFLQTLPPNNRGTADYFLQRFHLVMFSFIKGQLMLGILTGIYMYIIYSIFGVPYALLLGSFFAVAELLPVVGTYLGLTPGLLVILFTMEPMTVVWVWLCSYVYQTVKDNILAPKVVGNVMGLHPMVIILSLLICAKLAGLLGVLLALPLASALNVVLRYRGPQASSNTKEVGHAG